ncbi:2-polyprenylphenol 6-hydroxylase [Alphaproteobacteria bacterium]|nr:2-polyprenylphenol 6-hydroxylase [Alphaproteobacteria bacterium]
MFLLRLLKLLRMVRLLLAQDALLPDGFHHQAPLSVRAFRRVFSFGARRFDNQAGTHGLADFIRKLGPSYIKLGQFLATRPDVIGEAMAADLGHLQDRLPPFANDKVGQILLEELGDYSQHMSPVGPALAAASIAQVHQAHRPGNPEDKLAIKILRPNIEATLTHELAVFMALARATERFMPSIRRLRPIAAMQTLSRSIQGETDLRMEAAALSEMAANTKNDDGFCVPNVVWEASTRRVLTMQWIDGVPASDIKALRAAGHDLPALGQRLIAMFLTQALRDGFFHADMHQGNLIIQADGTITGIDLGITGRLDIDSRRFLAEILHGFITRDYYKVAAVHLEAGYVPAHHNVDEFSQALRSIGEPIRDQDADNISMARLLTQLFEVTEQFEMETQPQLLLLQKTMVTVEGVARGFDPKLNIWNAAEPIVSDWLKSQLGPQAILRDWNQNAGRTLRALRRLPDTLAQAERGAAALEAMAKNDASKKPNASGSRLTKLVSWSALALAVSALALSLL